MFRITAVRLSGETKLIVNDDCEWEDDEEGNYVPCGSYEPASWEQQVAAWSVQ